MTSNGQADPATAWKPGQEGSSISGGHRAAPRFPPSPRVSGCPCRASCATGPHFQMKCADRNSPDAFRADWVGAGFWIPSGVCAHLRSRLARGVRERGPGGRGLLAGPSGLQPAEEPLLAPVETPRLGHSGPPTRMHRDGQNLGRLWVQPPLQERQVTPASPLCRPGAETAGHRMPPPEAPPGHRADAKRFSFSSLSAEIRGSDGCAHEGTRGHCSPGPEASDSTRPAPHGPPAAASRGLTHAAVRVASNWSDDPRRGTSHPRVALLLMQTCGKKSRFATL